MKYEREQIDVQPHAIPRVPDKGVNWNIEVWLAVTVSGTVVFGIVIAWILWVMDAYPFVKIIFVSATALVPIMGIVMCILKLLEQWNKTFEHQTIDIGQFGTVFRSKRGHVQVISPEETFVLESQDATRTPVGQRQLAEPPQAYSDDMYRAFVERVERSLGKPIEEVPLDRLHELPDNFQDDFQEEGLPYTPLEASEGRKEGSFIDDSTVDMLQAEEIAAKKQKERNDRELKKARILRLHQAGMNVTNISVQVGMTGGSYEKFKVLCQELGIDTERRKNMM